MGMRNTLRIQLCRIVCGIQETWHTFLWTTVSDLRDSFRFPITGESSLPSIFIGYSGKTLSLPSFPLMWNTKSLLGPLKEEEIYVSISGPKKINVPFTFSHRLSLVGAFEKAETYFKFQESVSTPGARSSDEPGGGNTHRSTCLVFGAQNRPCTAGDCCWVCRSGEEANHPSSDEQIKGITFHCFRGKEMEK